jgi:hypothetical protein
VPAQVFRPAEAGATVRWADHPSHFEREQNAKRRYFGSPRDDRPAWLVFRNQADLRQQVTRQFYRACLNAEPDGPLATPESVQAFLDEERAAVTPDPRYLGVYDDRDLELQDVDLEIQNAEKDGPPDLDSLSIHLADLYPEALGAWVAEHRRRREEFTRLCRLCSGRQGADGETFEFRNRRHTASEVESLLETVRAEVEEDRHYLARLDRSAFRLFYHLAKRLGQQEEFRRRYGFCLELQRLLRVGSQQQARVESVLNFLSARKQVSWEEVGGVKDVVAEARAMLTAVLREAEDISLPALTHVPAGEPLACLLPPGLEAADSDSDLLDLNVGQILALDSRLGAVLAGLARIQRKSLVGILAFHEQLGSEWVRASSQGFELEAGTGPPVAPPHQTNQIGKGREGEG